jgi:hypothetical protein
LFRAVFWTKGKATVDRSIRRLRRSCLWLIGAALLLPAMFASQLRADPATAERARRAKPPIAERRYNELAYATTHNAMSNSDERWVFPNQRHGITRQLQDGVRGLMLDVHYDEGKPFLVHGKAALGKKPLADGLAEITGFLAANPDEIVTVIFECYVKADDVKSAFDEAKLLRFAHIQKQGQHWPTVGEMRKANHRLVVFTDRDGGAFPWYHDVWAFCCDTDWDNKKPEDFSSKVRRGKKSNELFILNHFLTNPLPSPRYAEQVNKNPFLIDRVRRFMAETDRTPNFITVDFYDIGDVLDVVSTVNGE